MVRKMALLDWQAMKYYQIRSLLVLVFVVFFGFVISPLIVPPLSVIMGVAFSLNPFAVEEKGNLNGLYLTLPVDRQSIVQGRFLLSGGIVGFALIFSIPIMAIVNVFGNSYYYLPIRWYVFIFAFSFLLYAILVMFMYPVLFKMGYSKGRFWGVILPAIIIGCFFGIASTYMTHNGGAAKLLDLLYSAQKNLLLVNGGQIIIGLLILWLAYKLSKKMYVKRDF